VYTRAVVFDFADLCTIDDYRKLIADKVKDLDIAMLFLNAGHGRPGAFLELEANEIQ